MYTIIVVHNMGYSLVTRIEQSEAEKLWEQVKDRPETLAAFFFDSFGYQRYTFTAELFEKSKGERPAAPTTKRAAKKESKK